MYNIYIFILLKNKYVEKETNLQRQNNLLKELNININNYLIGLEKQKNYLEKTRFFIKFLLINFSFLFIIVYFYFF